MQRAYQANVKQLIQRKNMRNWVHSLQLYPYATQNVSSLASLVPFYKQEKAHG